VDKRHYHVYVVLLEKKVREFKKVQELNPDGKPDMPCVYVGMTGLDPVERFRNHKAGYKSSGWVEKYGICLLPKLYEHLNPMEWKDAVEMEKKLAEDLRSLGYTVLGGH